VLTYSNWEFARTCFSESFESLSEGLQDALWTLGGVPFKHRTDCLTAAVKELGNREEFTDRYLALGRHYNMDLQHIQPQHPNENGDVEQSHNRLFERIDQALMLRGSRDFSSREEYEQFLTKHIDVANQARSERFRVEVCALRALPAQRLDSSRRIKVRVGPGSTVSILFNVYSVHSRLIGEHVDAEVSSEHIDIRLGKQVVERLPRLRGRGGHCIDYRHIIDWLVRKPGAFEEYVYRDCLFPSSHFRIAYDTLTASRPVEGKKDYLKLLKLAADEGQWRVERALQSLLAAQQVLHVDSVKQLVTFENAPATPTDVQINPINLSEYDTLLTSPFETRPTADAVFGSEVSHA